MNLSGIFLLGLSLAAQGKPVAPSAPALPETAADVATFRDGSVVLGQVLESPVRGTLVMLVRRDWAKKKKPEAVKQWQAAEAPTLRRAVTARKDRLNAWRQERAASAPANDPILAWIDREVERLSRPEIISESTLMVVKLNRAGMVSIIRRPKASTRMLRQGWLLGFPNVEEMPLEDLRDALEGRGFAPGQGNEVSIEKLLPLTIEPEPQWLARRAATEVANDPDLKFLQTQGLLMAEPAPGQPVSIDAAGSALKQLGQLLSDAQPTDPLADKLKEIAARGKSGASITRMEISPDLSSVRVEGVVMARDRLGRWMPVVTRGSMVQLDKLAVDAGKELEQDPQVANAFKLVESLGLGQVTDEMKQRSLKMGAATQKALGETRSALNEDLAQLAFPVGDLPPAEKKADPKP